MNKRRHKRKVAAASGPGTGARSRPQSRGKSTAVLSPSELAVPEFFCRALQKYPSLRRHPHPFVVHFPIVFFLAAAFFTLVYLPTDSTTFETTAFHCLGAGVLSLPPAMLTGELTRRVNYPQEPIRAFRIEIHYSRLLLALSAGAFLWRWLDPTILKNFRWLSLLYLLLILSLPVLVTIISYFGGLLTFPLEKEEN
jgi:uncharacterized membrane protein